MQRKKVGYQLVAVMLLLEVVQLMPPPPIDNLPFFFAFLKYGSGLKWRPFLLISKCKCYQLVAVMLLLEVVQLMPAE
jgi:hypothetical protein